MDWEGDSLKMQIPVVFTGLSNKVQVIVATGWKAKGRAWKSSVAEGTCAPGGFVGEAELGR